MPLEKQVCSLELAKKLKDFGVKQDSYFHWFHYEHTGGRWELDHSNEKDTEGAEGAEDLYLAAFTVAELGEMLPNCVTTRKHGASWYCSWFYSPTDVTRHEGNTDHHVIVSDTEANARAACLVYLLENGIITSNEINKGV